MQFDDSIAKKNSIAQKNNRALTELVYLDDSPDYCMENRSQGTYGTTGRVCT